MYENPAGIVSLAQKSKSKKADNLPKNFDLSDLVTEAPD